MPNLIAAPCRTCALLRCLYCKSHSSRLNLTADLTASAQYDVKTVHKFIRNQMLRSPFVVTSPYTRQPISDCYINLPVIALASHWHSSAGFARTNFTIGQWTQEKPPCLCPDHNEYDCNAIPATFNSSQCFENRLYGELASMRREKWGASTRSSR
jgi:hypothetical protein